MSLVIDDFCCKYCSFGNCSSHKKEIFFVDKITGLSVKAKCACTNHNEGDDL